MNTVETQYITNEYYARDTSRKIRSTFQSKGKSGKHLTGTVIYGYLWNEARDQWLVDPEAADVVKRIDIVNIGLHFFLKNVRPYAASCSEV